MMYMKSDLPQKKFVKKILNILKALSLVIYSSVNNVRLSHNATSGNRMSISHNCHTIAHFTIACSVTWPMNGNEAGVTSFDTNLTTFLT